MGRMILLIDLDRCIGCQGGCQVACKAEHDIALGPSRSTLYTMGPTGTYPELEMYFLPVMCQQCENPACVKVCPTGACYKSAEDGVIYIDRQVCIGCQSCKRACPYEANLFNKELRVMDKCDICAGLREWGEMPACVRNCAAAAIHVGDADDPNSEVSRLMAEADAEGALHALADAGQAPACRFILRNAAWIETLPHQFTQQMGGGRHG